MAPTRSSASRDALVKRAILIACALAFLGGALMLLGGQGVPDVDGGDGDKPGDAGKLFADLPVELSYEPLPADVRRPLEGRIEETVSDGKADVQARQIVRATDGATGVVAAITTGYDEDIEKALRENDEFRSQSISGTRFIVGPTSGGRVAFRVDGDRQAVAVYAATKPPLEAFAEPFARP